MLVGISASELLNEMNAFLKKEERKVSSEQPNFIYLKKLEKEEQSPKLI